MAEELHKELLGKLNMRKIRFNRWLKEKKSSDIAEILSALNDEQLDKFIKKSKNSRMAAIIEKAEEDIQVRLINKMSTDNIVEIFSYISNDEITDILGNISRGQRREILDKMKQGEANIIRKLLEYGEESAGGLMTTEYIAFQENLTIEKVIDKLEENLESKTANLETIFVLDEENRLVGKADLREILSAPVQNLLKDITNYNIITVAPELDQEEVSLLVSKYDLRVIPVVNKNNNILGIITVDDIIEVIEKEATEDMLMMVGVDKDERANSPLLSSIKKRLPWLYINLATAFLAAAVVGIFEDVISQVVALAVALPIVAGMGGNAGSQTLSIIIREIALGELDFKKNWKIVFKEIFLGLIHGTAIGFLTGIILYLNYNNIYLGLIIFLSMIANLVIAGLSGFLIPLTLKGLGVDPALAAAIFLTTATDVFGFFVFLGLAKILLAYL